MKLVLVRMTCFESWTKRRFWRETRFCWNDILWIQNQRLLLAGNCLLLEWHFVDPKPKAAFSGKLDFVGMKFCGSKTKCRFWWEIDFCWNDNLYPKPLLSGNCFLLEWQFVDPKPKAVFGGKLVSVGMMILVDHKPKAFCSGVIVRRERHFVDPKPKAAFWRENSFCWNKILWIQNQKPLSAGNRFLLENNC